MSSILTPSTFGMLFLGFLHVSDGAWLLAISLTSLFNLPFSLSTYTLFITVAARLEFPGWIQSTGHRGFNPPSDLSRGIYANATSPQTLDVGYHTVSLRHEFGANISRWVSILFIISKFGTTLWGARERLSYTPFLATNMLNTVNQNNQKATESGECSANVWDTGGNLRVLLAHRNVGCGFEFQRERMRRIACRKALGLRMSKTGEQRESVLSPAYYPNNQVKVQWNATKQALDHVGITTETPTHRRTAVSLPQQHTALYSF
ncbi:hypothetical protein B0H16DRAFT_1840770 [Mycena metata]|uniref:Uncharacterized protein n=1 Tax=Mycena metata TaxID=1033252 RepID=A0AAD7N9G5_9AGAR|nr:hypothetical protein B0H16DRAFT_1840770 [Mycena metata]